MRTILRSQDYSCRKLAVASSCQVSRPAGAEDLIKGGDNSPPAMPHPADACTCDNPTASSSPQCVSCRFL
ncbi:hypothetical protein K503DRAFT_776902 [Rhizopogon vinicolor AM-OR11-026]|uniref:Uncharacterized protein n=1 Tax=Rhizopogon vinicolor AM-OR11-026 TaxID=1314800 RepID=A0A1B7MHW0_9AGAM|nr:hypothetical protein K503DRAFT_776902 [Rhizopogon vinicolor AM-OR11-026]